MELQVENFDKQITAQCKNLVEEINEYGKLLGLYNPYERQKTDRIMIKLSYSIQCIKQIILPALSSGEIHGLPREATSSVDEPDVVIIDLKNPNWDFRPWFYEKFNNIETAYEKLLTDYEMDISTIHLAPNSGMKPVEYVVNKLKYELGVIKSYTEAILQMFDSGRLSVKDVRLTE